MCRSVAGPDFPVINKTDYLTEQLKDKNCTIIMEENWISVFRSSEVYQAELIKQKLEENGIHAVLINKHDSALPIGEAIVIVEASEKSKAKKVLAAHSA